MNSEFDGRTSEMILAETDPDKFINGLVDFVINPNVGGMSPLDQETAPPLVKGMIFLRAFRQDTFSSGIAIWFDRNYDDYPELVEFAQKIGAKNVVEYIKAATALFPKGRLPKDEDERFDYTDDHCREFHQVDLRFQNAADSAMLKFREYLLAHQEDFERQVAAFWELRKSNRAEWQKKVKGMLKRWEKRW